MKTPYPDLTDEDEERIRELVTSGQTLWEIRALYPDHRLDDLRRLHREVRRGYQRRPMPTPEEMEQLKAEVRRHWDCLTYGRRWVGRWAEAKSETLEMAASRLIPW